MRKQIVFYLLLFMLTHFSFSQQKEIDSLENIVSLIKNDSLRQKKLMSISKSYRKSNPEVQLHFINKAIINSNLGDNDAYKADAIRELGIYYRYANKLDSALIKCNESIALYKKLKDEYSVCISKNDKAIILNNQGDYLSAIKYYKEVVSYLETLGSKAELNVLRTKMNIGALYGDIKEPDKAIAIYEEVYNNPVTKKNKGLLSSICINLSYKYRANKKLDKALDFALEANKIEKRTRPLAKIKLSLATIYSNKKEFKKSESYYNEALKIYTTNNLVNDVLLTYHNMAYNYLEWEKYNKAEYYFLKAHQGIKNGEEIERVQKSYQGLSELYLAKKNYKKSLEYHNKERKLNDSLVGIKKQKAIVDFEVKYETEKIKNEKEKAIQETKIVKLQNQKNRNLFLGLLGVSILLLLTSLFYFGRLKAKKQTELTLLELKETQKRLAIEKQYKDSELKALKAQMNPHFIFNALNSIQEYIVLNQKNLASDYLGKFADLIRNYLHFSDTGFITISDEIHNLNLYLELEKLRFEEQLEYTFSVNKKDNLDNIKIPTMLIQPYVENALKHGLLHKKDNRKLSILISKNSNKTIECIIEDNGIGREASKKISQKRESQHKSFALKATTERLDLLNYGRDKKIGVEIIDLKNEDEVIGTKVILKIPILNR